MILICFQDTRWQRAWRCLGGPLATATQRSDSDPGRKRKLDRSKIGSKYLMASGPYSTPQKPLSTPQRSDQTALISALKSSSLACDPGPRVVAASSQLPFVDAVPQVSWPGRQLLAHDSSWFFTPCLPLQYLAMLELKLGFQAGGEVVLLALVVSCSSVWIAMYSRCHIS